MGLRGSSTTPIFFENCKVPNGNLLHEIGRGHIVAFNILNVRPVYAGRFVSWFLQERTRSPQRTTPRNAPLSGIPSAISD